MFKTIYGLNIRLIRTSMFTFDCPTALVLDTSHNCHAITITIGVDNTVLGLELKVTLVN